MSVRHVAVLAPMPLEMEAVTETFGLAVPEGRPGLAVGRVGEIEVTALHVGMGPAGTRAAVSALLDDGIPGRPPVDHVMIAGICGGLDPDVAVGTLVIPQLLVDHATGATFHHRPPGGGPLAGTLLTTEGVYLDPEITRRFFEAGYSAVDMESAAVAQVCQPRGHPWSVYRCIGDRPFDGLLDERLLALTNPDGSGRSEEIAELLAAEPDLAAKLAQLARDSARAARRAAEAALEGCRSLASA